MKQAPYFIADHQKPQFTWGPDLPYAFVLVSESGKPGYIVGRALMGKAIDWCADQFGQMPNRLDDAIRWYTMGGTVRFRNPEDATAFKLRWL